MGCSPTWLRGAFPTGGVVGRPVGKVRGNLLGGGVVCHPSE